MSRGAGGIRAGRAFVEIGANDAPLAAAIARVRARFASLGQVLASTGGGIIAAGSGILASLAWPLKLAANLEQAQVGFEVLLGSAQQASELIGRLNQFAAETPFQTDELNQAARMLLAFGSGADSVIDELRMLGDISSAIGAPLGEIAEIYGKARVQGRLFMEDINQLTGRGIPIIGQLAAQFGVAESKVRDLVSSGKVNFSDLEAALQSMTTAGGQFAGMMAKQSETLIGRWSTLKDNLAAAVRPLGQALLPIVGQIVSKFTVVAQVVGAFIEQNKSLAVVVASAGVGLVTLGGVLVALGGSLWAVSAAAGVLVSVLGTMAGLLASPWVLGGAAVAGLLVYFNQMGTVLETIQGKLSGVGESFAGFGKVAMQAWQGVLDAIAGGNMEAAFAIVTAGMELAWAQLNQHLVAIWGRSIAPIRDAWTDLITDLVKVSEVGFLTIESLWDATSSSMANLGDSFFTSLMNGIQRVIGFFDRLNNVMAQLLEKIGQYVPGSSQFLDGEAANARIAQLEEEYRQRARNRQQIIDVNREGSQAANAARDGGRNAAREQRSAEAGQYFNTLDQMAREEKQRRAAAQSAAVAAARARLEQKRAELDQLTRQAAAERAERERQGKEDLDKATAAAKQKSGSDLSGGAFNIATVAQTLGIVSERARLEKLNERTAKATERIADQADNGHLVFG